MADERAPEPGPGLAARAVSRARLSAGRATAWTIGARENHRSVDVGFRLADRDKRVAAGVLAGGLAYRLFFWLLSVSVLTTGALGVADGSWLADTLAEMGVGPVATDAVMELLRASDEARWWLLLVGGWLVLWTGYLGAKALVLVHAAVWGVPVVQRQRAWAMSLTFTGVSVAVVLLTAVADRVHARGGTLELAADLVLAAVPFGMWLVVSTLLPHNGAGWKDLVPGALLVGAGVLAFYQVTTVFLAPKLANATQLYGLLGVAATALFWFYVLGRLMIGAATLNASVSEQRSAAASPPGG